MPRLGAIQGDQQAVGDFVSVTAATLPAEHFSSRPATSNGWTPRPDRSTAAV